MRRGAWAADAWRAALFFLFATVLFTWPIAAHLTDGLGDIWDAKLNAWILHWDYHQVFRDPLRLYDANIFYPERYSLAFSENLLGAAVFAFPLYAVGVSTLAAYNVIFLLGMFLSAMACWALAREVTRDPLASVIAGIVYAFCPWRIAQVPHIQFQWGGFLVLALFFLLRYLDGGRRRDAIFFSVCLAWNALCNVHYALFSGFLVTLVLLYEGLVAGWPAFRHRLSGSLLAAAAAAAAVAPLLAPYAAASKLYGMQRGDEEIGVFSGVLTDFLTAGGQNKTYAALTERWAKSEGELFPGLTALALAAVALARRQRHPEAGAREPTARRRRIATVLDLVLAAGLALLAASLGGVQAIGPLRVREPGRIVVAVTVVALVRMALAFPRWSESRNLGDFLRRMRIGTRRGLFLAIAALGVLVALGTHTPYYRFLVQSLGSVFHVIRAPIRGIVLFDLALGVLAAWGLSKLTSSRKPAVRAAIAAAAIIAIGIEYRAFPLDVSPVDAEPPPVYRWLAAVSIPGGVVEWPLGNWYDQEYEFRSTAHWKPIVNGASGFAPPSYGELVSTLERRPIPEEVWPLLERRKTSLLVFHPRAVDSDTVPAYAAALKRGMENGRIELVCSIPRAEGRDFVFRLVSAGTLSLPAPRAPDEAERDRRLFESVLVPPFGFLDVPAEGETMDPGAVGFGWALDDSGVVGVAVGADGHPGEPALIGQSYPSVASVYPGYPDSVTPGFRFRVPDLAPGAHTLNVTILARDGGTTVLNRTIQVRQRPPRSQRR